MEKALLGKCGFYCGCCPTYRKGGCKGCMDEHQTGDCYTRDCVLRQGLACCGACGRFPCDVILNKPRTTVLDKDWLRWKKESRPVDEEKKIMTIKQIDCDVEKESIARTILEALPDWFGIPEAREEYIADSRGKSFFCAYDGEAPVGFLYLKETGRHTVELAVMGVLKAYHRKGIGRKLFEEAKKEARRQGYSFIQVKTVQMGRYDIYDDTNKFYIALGFQELEVFPNLWDEWNPCQIYIMAI